MKTKRLMLFAYDFPHKKTQDFLLRLRVEGYEIDYVIAAPWVKLNIPRAGIRIEPKHSGLIHPRQICKTFDVPYLIRPHNSQETINYLSKHPVDLGIIAGARILSPEVIEAVSGRIINIHPGLLPEARGLDTVLWSIKQGIPVGLSAHFISPKIDSGLLLLKERLPLFKDDTLIDISLRILESQPDFLIKTLENLKRLSRSDLKNLNLAKSEYRTKMTGALEVKTIKMFRKWLKKHSR